MSTFMVWCPEYGHEGPDDGMKVSAAGAHSAAQIWGRHSDSYGSDYTIANGSDVVCVVVDEAGAETRFRVSAEPSITYFAREES